MGFQVETKKESPGTHALEATTNVHVLEAGAWEPETAHQSSSLGEWKEITSVCVHECCGTGSWPLPRAGEERLVGILRSFCQLLGRYAVEL